MIKVPITILVLVSILLLPNYVSAHPGRTDSSGCHTCRTNCPKWGLDYDEYHCHGGYTAPIPTYSKLPTATLSPTRKVTRTYTPAVNSPETGTSSTDDNSAIFYFIGAGILIWIYKKLR